MIAALLGCAIVFALCAPRLTEILDPLSTVSYLDLIVMMIAILWRVGRSRITYLWLFALA